MSESIDSTPMSHENPNQQPAPLTTERADNFTKVMKAVADLTDSAHKIAQKGPSTSMLTYGPVLILLAVVLKVIPQLNLEIAEFSVLVACGTLLFISSAAIRLYQFKVQTEIDREIRQQAFRTLEGQQTAAISGAKVGAGRKAVL